MTEGRPRALIVDDDHAWQQILAEIMDDVGLEVDTVSDYEAAVDCMRATAYRVAMVDLSLSADSYHNRDGLKVLEALRAYAPGCVPILLTGYATVELAVEAMTVYGAQSCLRKETFRRAQFRDLLWRVLASPPGSSVALADAPNGELPVAGSELPEAAPQADAGLALVVENDAGWRSLLAELLAEAGYYAVACASYGEALGHLLREPVRLAVVDLSLGGSLAGNDNRDGYQVLQTTREAGVPSVVVTGLAAGAEARRAYADYGIVAYLEKQAFDRQVFVRAVGEAAAAGAAPALRAPGLATAASLAAPTGGLVDQALAEQVARLTPREREVLVLLVRGLTNKGIASALTISVNTVKRYLKLIFDKLEVNSRAAAVAKAVSAGIK